MADNSTGVRKLLSHPVIYEAVQYLVGAKRIQRQILKVFVKPAPGERILDLGCGPSEILRLLPEVDYIGIDSSLPYVRSAIRKFSHRGRFIHGEINEIETKNLGVFDIVIAIGVLHHLGDSAANNVFHVARNALAPGGRFFTVDPCFFDGQSWMSKFVVACDRGTNVRHLKDYAVLAENSFAEISTHLLHGSLPFPHAVCVLECR